MQVSQPAMDSIDYDIHGFLGFRIIGGSANDLAIIDEQFGPFGKKLDREADIVIRFHESIATDDMTHVGLNAGFNADGFYILNHYNTPVKVRIPFDQIGYGCEIDCETGINSIPLLFDIINLTFLKKGFVPVHGSALVENGEGILVLGWAKGGKTEALLSFANHGAQFVGDECVILTGDGAKMFGLPVPVCLWDWQIEQMNGVFPRIGIKDRMKFKLIRGLDWFTKRKMPADFLPVRMLAGVMPALRRQLKVKMAPDKLFRNRKSWPVRIDRVILLMSHNRQDIVAESCDPWEIALPMSHSNEYEMTTFFEYYRAFKFAFPQLKNPFLERAGEIQATILANALQGKDTYKLRHPYPVSFEALHKHMKTFTNHQSNSCVPVRHQQTRASIGIESGKIGHLNSVTTE